MQELAIYEKQISDTMGNLSHFVLLSTKKRLDENV